MNMTFSFKTPIGYAIAGSFFLHIILVSMYATLLISEEIPSPPPPPKKFKIEMVTKKPKPIKKMKVKEKKIIRPKKVRPIKIKRTRSARSAQKIRKKEIALQPMSQMVPVKPKMARDQSIHSSRKSFQMAKANISVPSRVSKPQTIEKLQISEITTLKVQRSSTEKAKLADISPLPRPVEKVRTASKVTDKEVSFHASAVSFAPSFPKPKSISVASVPSSGGRASARIHDGQKVLAHSLPRARKVVVANIQRASQKKAAELKNGPASRSLAPALAAMRPSAYKLESVTAPDKVARFYEAKTRIVSTLPLARASSVIPPSNRIFSNNKKTGYVQKGELVASSTFPSPRPVPDIVDPRILDGYLGTLQKLIASAKQYPESARQSGREGKVTVQFTVLKNGAVKNVQLVSKTNYPELNEEAIAAVKRAAPFSGLPEEIDKSFLDIILPFRFKLNE